MNNKAFSDATILGENLNSTLSLIFDNVRKLIDEGNHEIAINYITGLAVDMLGKALTYPGAIKGGIAQHISSLVKERYDLNLDIKIQHSSDETPNE